MKFLRISLPTFSFFGPSETVFPVHFGQAYKKLTIGEMVCAYIYEGNPDGRVVTICSQSVHRAPSSTSQKNVETSACQGRPQRRSLAAHD